MPLYEGIALIQEKQAVVLDIGTEYTKFGLSGEAAPRCIVRSEYFCQHTRRMQRVMEYKDDEQLYHNLVQLLHQLFFRHALVNPKERRVVAVQSCLATHKERHALARALYAHYEVASVLWLDSAVSAAAVLALPAVLSVCVGASAVSVCAVLHGVLLPHTVQTTGIATQAMQHNLLTLLQQEHPQLQLPHNVLHGIMVKSCFVCERKRAAEWREGRAVGGRAARCMVGGMHGVIAVSARCREMTAEVLFERDSERLALPDLILRCLMSCPIDARKQLAESILLWGGGAKLPGLRARVAEELRLLLEEPPYNSCVHVQSVRFHNAPCHSNYTAWLGAAVMGAAECWGRALTREQWRHTRHLPDWSDTRDNLPHNHHLWKEHTPPPA